MDKEQMQKERERLQAVLDGYNAVRTGANHHPSLAERIHALDTRIAASADH